MEKELLETKVRFEGAVRDSLEKAVKSHIETHNGVTLVDIVKFLYQSILGAHHVLDHMNDKQIETWIKEQLESAEPADRPLMEPLFGTSWVRLDLEAFKHKHGDNYRLATRMFIKGRSVKKVKSSEFSEAMERLNKLLSNRKIRSMHSQIDLSVLADRFLRTYRQMGFPPLHHSASYTKQNPPYIIVPSQSPMPKRTCASVPAPDKRRNEHQGLYTANKNEPKIAKTMKKQDK
jgi:hypothetical protein